MNFCAKRPHLPVGMTWDVTNFKFKGTPVALGTHEICLTAITHDHYYRKQITLTVTEAPVVSHWTPDGWVYLNWPYVYADGGWHFFDTTGTQCRVDLSTNQWETLADGTGWHYFNWPYAYSIDAATWHWYDQNSIQWVVDLSSGIWSLLGE